MTLEAAEVFGTNRSKRYSALIVDNEIKVHHFRPSAVSFVQPACRRLPRNAGEFTGALRLTALLGVIPCLDFKPRRACQSMVEEGTHCQYGSLI